MELIRTIATGKRYLRVYGSGKVEIDTVPKTSEPVPVNIESVLARNLSEDQLSEILSAYDSWKAGVSVSANQRLVYNGRLYKVIQSHTTQSDWTPDIALSLFTESAPTGVIPDWKQPLGAHDAYPVGYKVLYNNRIYESTIDANVWSPTAYPAGWTDLGPVDGEEEIDPIGEEYEVWKPWDGYPSSLYQVGDIVWYPAVDTTLYIATLGNNHWRPDSGTGWVVYVP